MNVFCGIGNITGDLELKYSQDQKASLRFGIAIKGYGDHTDFINCVAFGKTAEHVAKYYIKGSKIGVQGRVNTGSYTNKDGQKIYTTDIIVDSTFFCEKAAAKSEEPKADAEGFMDIPEGLEEELPFN